MQDNGGSVILDFDLQIDDGFQGEFFSIYQGIERSQRITQGIIMGREYRVKFRVRNVKGFSEFSDEVFVLIADVPSKPSHPIRLVSASESQIVVNFEGCTDSNGSPIENYQLYYKTDVTAEYSLIRTITEGASREATLTVLGDSLTAGQTIFLRYKAVNIIGASEFSNQSSFTISDLPSAPTNLRKIDIMSSLTSIYLVWDFVEDTSANVLGYIVEIDEKIDGNFKVIYNGLFFPGVNFVDAQYLNTGEKYRFRVAGLNFNGIGPYSQVEEFFACKPPLDILPPTFVSST